MTVSLVIPHWNRRLLLESVIASIERLDLPEGMQREIVVVDNGSTDGSGEAAKAAGAKVVRLDENRGVSRALNEGIREARGEYVVLLNNDVELAQDWLKRLIEALENTGAWFATGKTLNFVERSTIDGAGDAICRGGAAWRLGHGRADGPVFAESRSTYFPSATAAVFRRTFFDRVGLLEESFFAYLEDVDLGLRAALEDLSGVYVPEAVAYHRGSETAVGWSAAMVRWITAHQLLLIAKYYPLGLLLRFARPILAAQLLWGALAISRGRTGAWLLGLGDGLVRAAELRRAGRSFRSGRSRLEAVLRETEREILTVQSATGWDSYWKWYRRLTWPAAEGGA